MMEKYTIQEIAKILVEKNGLSQRDANRFATEMFAIILEQLQQGDFVKVKGLGTFKIINVEARASVSVRTGERVLIDSHSKVSFTPDSTMKELVNKPFSQFETVTLNEGVEFDDLEDDTNEDTSVIKAVSDDAPVVEPVPEFVPEYVPEPVVEPVVEPIPEFIPEPVPEPVVESVVEPVVEPTPEPVVEPVVEPVPEPDPEPIPEPVVEPSPIVEPIPEPAPERESAPEPVSDNKQPLLAIDDNPQISRWLLVVMGFVGVAVAMLSAYGGYQYGIASQPYVADTVMVRDTVFVPLPEEEEDSVEQFDVTDEQHEMAEEEKPQPQPEVKTDEASEIADKYAKKDERVRLGAYRIVGTAQVVTVKPGQTFYSLCRAYLGPDMECYVEVYNDLPPEPRLNAGQTLKIPKLERKKAQKNN